MIFGLTQTNNMKVELKLPISKDYKEIIKNANSISLKSNWQIKIEKQIKALEEKVERLENKKV